MEEYRLNYQWIEKCEWVWSSSSFRSKNFGTPGREWFFSYIAKGDICILELYREEIYEPVRLKGFVVIGSEKSQRNQQTILVDCTMNAGEMKTKIADVLYSEASSYEIINITCGIFITKIVEWKEKSVQSETECIPTLDDPMKLSLTASMQCFSNLSHHMREMYDKHDYSDFVLVCNNLEFHAHKCILSARSPVFAQMLHSMLETTDNRMLITDMDADILEKLLLFMYSGQANLSSYSQARDLYCAADNYAVYDLKRICGEFIPSFLSNSTALETLILSDRHQDDDLMNKVITFIASVFEEMRSTEAWNVFIKENVALGTKVLSFVVEQLYKKT